MLGDQHLKQPSEIVSLQIKKKKKKRQFNIVTEEDTDEGVCN